MGPMRRTRCLRILAIPFLVVALLACVLTEAAQALKYSAVPLITEFSTPCQPAKEVSEVECQVIVEPLVSAREKQGSGENGGLDPENLQSAYNLSATGGSGRTVAIVDSNNNPYINEDLKSYRKRYHLPECDEENGCFIRVNQKGEADNYPEDEPGWGVETTLDVEMVSAACPECRIMLVEAGAPGITQLGTSNEEAVRLGGTTVSNSWGSAGEFSEETEYNHYFDHPGTPAFFAGGDEGYGAKYPASSPYVVAVGGTELRKEPSSSRGWEELVWNRKAEKGGATGSGCSKYEPKPAWQHDPACSKRMANDTAAVATELLTFDSYGVGTEHWLTVAGTSASTPFTAAVDARSSRYSTSLGAESFYVGKSSLFDVALGNDGTCTPPAEDEYFCTAETGYDGPTGNGTPDGPLELEGSLEGGPRPSVWTGLAGGVSESHATLHGTVDPLGSETSYQFEYGPTTAYGSSVPVPAASVGSGSSSVEVSRTLTGLTAGTEYHYRVVATNANGTIDGADRTFSTNVWHVGTTANLGEVKKSDLRGMSCVSSSACVSVGEYENVYGVTGTVAEQWNGTQWQAQATPAVEGAKESYLLGVSCTSSSTCIATGAAVNGEGTKAALAESWNGSAWTVQKTAAIKESKGSVLRAVSCSSASACEAVGEYETSAGAWLALAESWNGSSWKLKSPTVTGATSSTLHSVTCLSSTSCTAVGWYLNSSGNDVPLGTLWNGSKWSQQTTAYPTEAKNAFLTGVTCESICMAVGWYENTSGKQIALGGILFSSEWILRGAPGPSEASKTVFQGVSCAAGTECVATGSYEGSSGGPQALVERWTGSEWEVRTAPAISGARTSELQAVSCSSSWCDAAGSYEGAEGGPQAVIEGGTSLEWHVASAADLGEVKKSDLRSISCVSSSACVAVGEYENVYGVTDTVAEQWNGTQWQVSVTPAVEGAKESYLLGVSCTSASACIATGAAVNGEGAKEALAESWNGSAWTIQKTAAIKESKGSVLRSVSCSSASACEAVGEYETSAGAWLALAESWNGSSWKLKSPTITGALSSTLRGVSCLTEGTWCTAVGWYQNSSGQDVAASESWDGKKWTAQRVVFPAESKNSFLNGVSCTGNEKCLAVGWNENNEGTQSTFAQRMLFESYTETGEWTTEADAWELEPTPQVPGAKADRFEGLYCVPSPSVSTKHCAAVGSQETTEGDKLPLAEGWTAGWELVYGVPGQWNIEPTSAPSGASASELQSVWCESATTCDATGAYANGEGTPLALEEKL